MFVRSARRSLCLVPRLNRRNQVFSTFCHQKYLHTTVGILRGEHIVRKSEQGNEAVPARRASKQSQRKIAENIIRTNFSRDRFIPPAEWEGILRSLVGLNTTLPPSPLKRKLGIRRRQPEPERLRRRHDFIITEATLTSLILAVCASENLAKVCLSYFDFSDLHLEGITDRSVLLSLQSILQHIDIKKDEELVVKITERVLHAGIDVVQPELYWEAIKIIAETKEWRRGWQNVQGLTDHKNFNSNAVDRYMLWRLSKRGNPAVSSMGDWHGGLVDPCLESVEATAALAVRALAENDEDTAWQIMASPFFLCSSSFSLRLPTDRTHRVREAVFKAWLDSCKATKSNPKETHKRIEKLFRHLRSYNLHVSTSFSQELKSTYDCLDGFAAKIAQINHHTGACQSCGATLEKAQLTPKEFKKLKAAVEILIKERDTFNEIEFNNFIKCFRKKKRFDVVIDGLNVASFITPDQTLEFKPHGVQGVHLSETVKLFNRFGKEVVLIVRPDVKKMHHYLDLKELSHMIILDSLTDDDPYFLYAALLSGPDCLFLSNDFLMDHYIKILRESAECADLFQRWQVSHQITLLGFELVKKKMLGKPRLEFPPVHTINPSRDGSNWHLPILRDGAPKNLPASLRQERGRLYHANNAAWLCVGPERPEALQKLSENRVVKTRPAGQQARSGQVNQHQSFGRFKIPDWSSKRQRFKSDEDDDGEEEQSIRDEDMERPGKHRVVITRPVSQLSRYNMDTKRRAEQTDQPFGSFRKPAKPSKSARESRNGKQHLDTDNQSSEEEIMQKNRRFDQDGREMQRISEKKRKRVEDITIHRDAINAAIEKYKSMKDEEDK